MRPRRVGRHRRGAVGEPGSPASSEHVDRLTLRWTRTGALFGAAGAFVTVSAVLGPLTAPRSAALSVVDVTLRDDGEIDGVEDDGLGETARTTVPATVLDISVLNHGPVSALVLRANLRVLEAAAFPTCLAEGGGLGVTADYDLKLPPEQDGVAPRPQTVTAVLHQHVEAGKADRFTLTLGSGGNVYTTATTVYRVAVDLQATGKPSVLSLGPFLVAPDLDDPARHFLEEDPSRRGCVKANRALFADLLRLPGQRAPGIDAAVALLTTPVLVSSR